MIQIEALIGCGCADADPGDVALADVLNARGAIDEVMDLALEDWLEILIHLATGHLDDGGDDGFSCERKTGRLEQDDCRQRHV